MDKNLDPERGIYLSLIQQINGVLKGQPVRTAMGVLSALLGASTVLSNADRKQVHEHLDQDIDLMLDVELGKVVMPIKH